MSFELDLIEFDKLKRINVDGKRMYLAEGSDEPYPSVTTITSLQSREAIRRWRERVGAATANRITTQAANRGTSAHKLIEDYIVGKESTSENPVATDLFLQLKKQADEMITGPIRAIEAQMSSKYLRAAGTVDCVAEIDGKLSIVDWKTSKKPKQRSYCYGYFMQAAAYAVMFEENTGIPVSQLVIIGSSEEGEPWQFIEKRDGWIQAFMDLRKLFDEENRSKSTS